MKRAKAGLRLATLAALSVVLTGGARCFAKTCSVATRPLSEAETAELRDDTGRALRLYREQASREPTELRWQERVIRMEMAEGKPDQAWNEAQRLVMENPASADAHLAMAEAHLMRGEFDPAMEDLKKALAADTCNARVLKALGELQELQGHRAAQGRTMSLAHRLSPLEPEVLLGWAASRPAAEKKAAYGVLASSPAITEEQRQRLLGLGEAAALVAASSCTVAPAKEAVTVPLNSLDAEAVQGISVPGVPVTMNGHGEILALTSPGDAGLVVTRAVAASLGLKHDSPTYRMARGGADAYWALLDRLVVGSVEYHNCPVKVIDEDFEKHFHGGISLTFFGDFAVTTDLRKRELHLDTLPKLEGVAVTGWSHAEMGGPEVPSVATGDWAASEPGVPVDKRDWMHAYQANTSTLIPVTLGPDTERLFVIEYRSERSRVQPATARAATPVAKDASLPQRVKEALHGSPYSLRTGEVILPVETWNEDANLQVAGTLAEDLLRQIRMTEDFRDALVTIKHSSR